MRIQARSIASVRPALAFALIASLMTPLTTTLGGCSDAGTTRSAARPEATNAVASAASASPSATSATSVTAVTATQAAPAEGSTPELSTRDLSAQDVLAQEAYWPDIVALTEAWTPGGGGAALKPGYRGALIRVEPTGRVRIAFGRHGNHDVPIGKTDLVERANQVRRGELHNVAPAFLAHFGAQFIAVEGSEVVPVPTARIANAQRFLLVFADPRKPEFESEARALAVLRSGVPDLQILYFPIGLAREQTVVVRDALTRSGLLVPFAYPAAAEVHTRSLLGSVPDSAQALLITPAGRILERGPVGATAWVAQLTPPGGASSPNRP